MTWVDGLELNNEHVMFSTSTNGGDTWPIRLSVRRMPPTVGTTPRLHLTDGTNAWLVYNAFTATVPDEHVDAAASSRGGGARERDLRGRGAVWRGTSERSW